MTDTKIASGADVVTFLEQQNQQIKTLLASVVTGKH
jgi:hypothetical protein